MKTKQLYTLGIILAILIVAVVIKQQQNPKELVRQDYSPLDFEIDKDKVHSIKITKPPVITRASDQSLPEESVHLIHRNDEWQIEDLWNARAEKEKVEALLAEVTGAKGEIRASDKALFKDFGIEADQSYRMTYSDSAGKPLLDFLISMKKADYQYLFVRKEGSPKVYLTEANFYGIIGTYGEPKETELNQDYWADLRISGFNSREVNRIEVHRFGKNPVLEVKVERFQKEGSDQNQWKFVDVESEFGADAGKIKTFLVTLENYNAKKVIDPSGKDYGFENFTFRLTLGIEGGDDVVYTIGELTEEGQSYPLKVSNQPVLFKLSKHYAENMNADISKFETDPPPEEIVNPEDPTES